MAVRFIDPVRDTLTHVLGSMKLQPSVGEPVPKNDLIAHGDVTGQMRMVGSTVRGSLAISFSQPVIFDIAHRMLGARLVEIDDLAKDLTGEMANMVFGGAKNIIVEKGYDVEMTLPEVYAGPQHEIIHGYRAQTLLLPCRTESGDFYIEICFEDVS